MSERLLVWRAPAAGVREHPRPGVAAGKAAMEVRWLSGVPRCIIVSSPGTGDAGTSPVLVMVRTLRQADCVSTTFAGCVA
jgi:hypothetical protein